MDRGPGDPSVGKEQFGGFLEMMSGRPVSDGDQMANRLNSTNVNTQTVNMLGQGLSGYFGEQQSLPFVNGGQDTDVHGDMMNNLRRRSGFGAGLDNQQHFGMQLSQPSPYWQPSEQMALHGMGGGQGGGANTQVIMNALNALQQVIPEYQYHSCQIQVDPTVCRESDCIPRSLCILAVRLLQGTEVV